MAATGGCASGGGRLGIVAGAEVGARFIAGPAGGGSGTEAGGTGGGRSENNCAKTECGTAQNSTAVSTTAMRRRVSRPDRLIREPREDMADAFTENAANSSLPANGKPSRNP